MARDTNEEDVDLSLAPTLDALARGHLVRKRRTAFIVRRCYDNFVAGKPPDADSLHALCMLTWLSGHREGTPAPDNTKAVVSRAFAQLTRQPIQAKRLSDLPAQLNALGLDPDVAVAAASAVGFVNFYPAYRNSSRDWMRDNVEAVHEIASIVATARDDLDARRAMELVGALPPIYQPPGSKPTAATNLLTPMLACLDPRGRTPVINEQVGIAQWLKALGLKNATLAAKFDAMVAMIGTYGATDAFEVDTVLNQVVHQGSGSLGEEPKDPGGSSTNSAGGKPMKDRADSDVFFFQKQSLRKMERIHRTMERALRRVLSGVHREPIEGRKGGAQYDAFVENYSGKGRDLLIELKSDSEMPTCRLAVGQLWDYKRAFVDRSMLLDLAVLFPSKPNQAAIDFLSFVGVRVLWFTQSDLERAMIETSG